MCAKWCANVDYSVVFIFLVVCFFWLKKISLCLQGQSFLLKQDAFFSFFLSGGKHELVESYQLQSQ